jgi:UDP-glucose 4-epimerase
MKILLTGGAGYIGSHTAVALLDAGHELVVIDNLSNSQASVISAIEQLSGKKIDFVHGDIRDAALLKNIFRQHAIDGVIHFAGLKAVGESVREPLAYFDNNVGGTIALLQAMTDADIRTLVFSSSATVYGDPQYIPIDELHPTSATSPYGRTKLHIEQILADLADSDPRWKIICLRYFNPVGAHESGLIGESPNGIPNNLMPYIVQVADQQRPFLNVFGNDYPTIDGTGVRDYIHVLDLAEGHLAALDFIIQNNGWHAVNLGTGKGLSVLELLKQFELANGITVPYQITERREGDVAVLIAANQKAENLLDFKTKRCAHEMCASSWAFQRPVRGEKIP